MNTFEIEISSNFIPAETVSLKVQKAIEQIDSYIAELATHELTKIQAKRDKADLNKLKKLITEHRRQIYNDILERSGYNQVLEDCKKIDSHIQVGLDRVEEYLKSTEKPEPIHHFGLSIDCTIKQAIKLRKFMEKEGIEFEEIASDILSATVFPKEE